MVGFAKTVTIRARDPVNDPSYMQKRMDYLDYVAAAPRPSVVVIEDKDEPPGFGALWREVQTNVTEQSKALAELVQKIALAGARPLQEGVAKAFTRAA